MKPIIAAATLALLAGCQTSSDPAAGGFFNGVAGVSSGSYQARVDALEGQVATEQERQAALQAELAGLRSEHGQLKLALAQQRSRLSGSGVAVPAELDAKVNAAIRTTPSGTSEADQVAALRLAIQQARALSEDLSDLSV